MHIRLDLYETLKRHPNFFANIYTYFIRGGYRCILVENVLNIIVTLITLISITFVCFYLDWDSISTCESESTCTNFDTYIIKPISFHNKSAIVFMIIFMVIFVVYWIWTTLVLISDILKYLNYKDIFEKNLEIAQDELKVLSWPDVINKLKEYDSSLTVEGIIGSIMRKDNYLIAMISTNIFSINTIFYTNTFLWLINVCILNQIFPLNTTEIDFANIDTNKIKKIVRNIGLIQIVLLPFTLIIMLTHYIISFTTDIYTKKSYIGPKEWTLYAKLSFREYNELSHIFNERLIKSHKYAIQYEEKFNAHMMNIITEKVIFLLGTYLTILVCMTLWDERKVMYITLFNRNLLWYIAILTSAITVARFTIVYPSTVEESAEEIMKHMAKHTHYYPEKWKNKCNTYNVFNEFKALYKYKIISMFIELLSIVTIPIYMIIKIPDDINLIVEFIKENTIIDQQIGYICKHGVLSYVPTLESRELDVIENDDIYLSDNKQQRSSKSFLSYYEKSLDERSLRIEKKPLLVNT